jgi:hypothetical protein
MSYRMVASSPTTYPNDTVARLEESQVSQPDVVSKRGMKRSSPYGEQNSEASSPKRKIARKESTIFNGAPTSKKNKISIPVHDIVRLLTVPQPIAAKALNVSVSTLKRRYYELSWGRWPANQMDALSLEESANRFEQEREMDPTQKARITHVTNLYNTHSCTALDSLTYKVLQCAFKSTKAT